jgi:DNA-binding beta-propeller fold protein YncE
MTPLPRTFPRPGRLFRLGTVPFGLNPSKTLFAFALLVAIQLAGGFDATAEKVYWTNQANGKIQRCDLFGGDVEDLVTGLTTPTGIALDLSGGKIYWCDRGSLKIQRSNLDGSNVEDLVTTGLSYPHGIALDTASGKMYWTDYTASKVARSDLDGTGTEDVASVSWPKGIALDTAGGKIYVISALSPYKILRCGLDGSDCEDLVGTSSAPEFLALDVEDGKVYWADNSGINRASMIDGSGAETVVARSYLRSVCLDVERRLVFSNATFYDFASCFNMDGEWRSSSYHVVPAWNIAIDLTPRTGLVTHAFKFFLDPAILAGADPSEAAARLSKYVDDLNVIYGKNTSRRFSFDPDSGLVLSLDPPFSGGCNYSPRNDFEIWAHAVLSDYPGYSHDGYSSCDASGAGVSAGMKWAAVYDPDLLSDGSDEQADYCRQIHILTHEIGHVFGVALGEYYNLNVVYDNTGYSPDMDINCSAFSSDVYWSRHLDYVSDPMRVFVWNLPLLGCPKTRADFLDETRFADVSAAIIDLGLRSSVLKYTYLPDMHNVRVRVLASDSMSVVPGAYVKVWSVISTSPYETELVVQGLTDGSGEFVFDWDSTLYFGNYDHLRLIKASAGGVEPGGSWVSVYDAQEAKILDSLDELTVEVILGDATTGVPDKGPEIPFLAQNSPNPFTRFTRIAFSLGEESHVGLRVFDSMGRLVKTLADERLKPDIYVREWDGTNDGGRRVAAGVYFYRLETSGNSYVKKMTFAR